MTEIGGMRSNSLFRAFLDGETRGEETLSKDSIGGEKCVMKVTPEHPREVFPNKEKYEEMPRNMYSWNSIGGEDCDVSHRVSPPVHPRVRLLMGRAGAHQGTPPY